MIFITHDIDNVQAQNNVLKVFSLERKYNVVSTWFFVPKMKIDYEIIDLLVDNGNEIGVHGYNHRVILPFLKKHEIEKKLKEAIKILARYKPIGFRAPMFVRTEPLLDVVKKLFKYDSSFSKNNSFKNPFILPNGLIEIPINVSCDANLYTKGYNHMEILKIYKKEITDGSILVTHPTPYFHSNPFYEILLKFLKGNKFGLLKDLLED